MAEIVYDEAPGISGIVFGSGTIGSTAKAAAIDALVARGVKVISDDTVTSIEPFFQDGIVAQAVDRAKAAGVAYFSSAGNRERRVGRGRTRRREPVPDEPDDRAVAVTPPDGRHARSA